MSRGKRNVSVIHQEEPSFIRQFKQRIGYKEGPNVDTKRMAMPPSNDDEDDDDYVEPEEEKPQVVVLTEGDLTKEEADLAKTVQTLTPASVESIVNSDDGGKIVFKKPVKRSIADSEEKKDTEIKDEKSSKKKSKKSSKKTKMNTKLLSFNEDEEEED